jgi:hypothetical protein
MTSDRRNSLHLCLDCLQDLVVKARLSRDARALALWSRARWLASQKLLGQAEAVVRGSTA